MRTARAARWAVVVLGAMLSGAAATCHRALPEVGRAERVVLVSFDGVGADLAWRWLAEGVTREQGGLADLARHGLAARRLRMADPTLTAVNHLCLATGAWPSGTGVVSNRFHRPGTPITESVDGFTADSEAETLWQLARRKGRRVGVLLWPGADGVGERRGDFGLVWPTTPLARPEVLRLEPAAAVDGPWPASSDGVAAVGWRLEVALGTASPGGVTVELAAVDATADGRAAYDRVAVRLAGGEWRRVEDLGWFDLQVVAPARGELQASTCGAWCKVLALDSLRGSVQLYRGAFYPLLAYPRTFAESVESELGFWPGPPDERALGRRWMDPGAGIDPGTFLEQAERLDRYVDRSALLALEAEEPDLLLVYHATPDEYQHAALIADERQAAHSPGAAATAREGLDRVGRCVDRSVASLWRALSHDRDALVVVSDHGHLPTHEQVNLNAALAQAGLLAVDTSSGRPRVGASSRVVAVAGGGCAHLYLNLDGREPDGVVAPAEAEAVLRRAARVVADIEVEGEAAVERIVTRREASKLGLDHPASGDLIVFLRPGYTSGWGLGDRVLEPSAVLGQHGHLSHHDALCGVLLARGAGVPRGGVGEIPVTDVAPMVWRLLGL